MSGAPKQLRCAIYTRKSTEHGLELEFNSLDAQREACEAYIKSQTSQGWRALPQQYNDPAYSGGNLDRPALKMLLKDIDAGRVDVVVVYKIDRLTRSLADFAKLVEAFDARSISFVAVTQQFNTTTSMGRLTLNVLLSFAQFERELSSERVRDKIAASRAKGKWTGGSIPFGYRTENKKLVVFEPEAATVRYIFKRYLELGSFEQLVLDLDKQNIKTRPKKSKTQKTAVPSRFTYGPLAYLLNNRIYVGDVPHKGKWFAGEQEPIVDAQTFANVHQRLRANAVVRKNRRSESGALLMGKLFDDRDNRMSPSYSTKNGARYRFYVSTALLRGRKAEAGSLPRISAIELETAILNAVRSECPGEQPADVRYLIERFVDKVEVHRDVIVISLALAPDQQPKQIRIPWAVRTSGMTSIIGNDGVERPGDPKLIQALVQAHAWLRDLSSGRFSGVEALATSLNLHPKVIRQRLRLAFVAPAITEAILTGHFVPGLTVTKLVQNKDLDWVKQCRAVGVAMPDRARRPSDGAAERSAPQQQ